MKKQNIKKLTVSLLLTVLLAFSTFGVVFAAEDNIIADNILKNALLDTEIGPDIVVDTNDDGNISQGELAALSGTLSLAGLGITDLTGMEYATGISILYLSGNQIESITPLLGLSLTKLDISNNYLNINSGSDDLADIQALVTAGCSVTYEPQNPEHPTVTGISLNQGTLALITGQTGTLTAAIAPEDAANQNVTWSSNNGSVATVSNGTVTAVAPGTATITVTTEDGGFTANCTVSVSAIPVSGVSLNKSSLLLCTGDVETLTASVSPSNAANQNVSWSSSKPDVVTVSNGTITAVAPGTATITVTTQDGGKTANCTVTVKAATLQTSKYTIQNELLLNVSKLTSPAQLKKNFDNEDADIHVYGVDGKEFSGERVGTGMTVKLIIGGVVRQSLTVVIKGDTTGDGIINITDYTSTRLDILNLKKLSNSFIKAADIDSDGKVSITDYTQIRLDILKLKSIGGSDLPEVSDARIRKFLDIALAQQGKPYLWSEEGPDSFDCSGYVYYCLREAGYTSYYPSPPYKSFYRATANTYSSWSSWQYVDKNALQPGDLMFYYAEDNPSRIGHIGIYLGNGYHIHASSSYECVIICRVDGWYEEYLSHGRRAWY